MRDDKYTTEKLNRKKRHAEKEREIERKQKGRKKRKQFDLEEHQCLHASLKENREYGISLCEFHCRFNGIETRFIGIRREKKKRVK